MNGSALKASHSLKKAFFEASSDTHGLAGSLHLCAEALICIGEFIKGEPGHLGYDVIKCRLETCGRVGKLNLFEIVSDTYLGGYSCDGISRCLGSKGRGSGYSGVNLDQVILERFGIKGKLNVTSSADLQGSDELKSRVTEHVIFFIGKSLGRAYYNGVTGMDSYGIEVFHVTYSDCGIIGITYYFILDLFIALNALFYENFADGRKFKSRCKKLHKFFFIVRKSAAGSAEGECGTKYYGIADLISCLLTFFDAVNNY